MFQDFYAQSRHLIWPLLGLLIFALGFVIVLIYAVFGLRDSDRLRHLARLPLEPDSGEPREQTGEIRRHEDKGKRHDRA